MAVDDLWKLRDGTRSKRYGRGLRYRVRVKGYPATLCRTKAEADALNARRLVAGPPKPKSTMTVGEGLDRWLASKEQRSSYASFKRTATAVRHRWGSVLIADVTAHDVQVWVNGMTSIDRHATIPGRPVTTHPASASTRRQRLQALRGAIAEGVRAGAVERDPTAKAITLPRLARREPSYLTAQQLAALATASSMPAMIWLMGTTGVRSGEVARLTVGDVVQRRTGARLRIRTSKNGAARDVPITPEVLAMLDLDRPAGAPLFTSPEGHPLQMRNWRSRVFDPAVKEAGMQGLTPHDLRHTAVSLAIAACADVKVVQRFAGHKTAAMTMDVYGHLMDESLDDVAARIGAALSRGCTRGVWLGGAQDS